VSWQLSSFLLLALALLAGFAWYERSHPSSRVLALVGTLAALAVLGRIAFAAIPNVKPTTDIVLLAGYVFGGAPGFAVGAVTALVSNLFFTQGPWTPWQMGAWGAIGVFGALLASLSRGRLGRVPLALACGLAGLAFGVVVNFGSVVTVGDQDVWGRFAAYQAGSLPWDLAHATGNVVFCLAFGPALVRTLRRFRTRFEFAWAPAGVAIASASPGLPADPADPAGPPARPGRAAAARPTGAAPLLLAALALLAASTAIAVAAPGDARAASTPIAYLERVQNRDGGFGAAPGQSSVDLFTGWVALGLAAQGRNPQDVRRGGTSLLDYTSTRARNLARADAPETVGDLERTIMVVAAAGRSPRAFAGQDLVAGLRRRFDADGSVLRQTNLTAFGVLALRSARVPARDAQIGSAADWLARQQNRDGGWGFATKGGGSDVDDTAAVVQALVAAGRRTAPPTRKGLAFLRANQNPDGGLPLLPGQGSNAMSTGWAVQAFLAAGVRPERVRRRGARSPVAYLRSLIGPSGVVQFSRTSRQTPVWSTGTAAIALAGRSFPLTPARRGAASASDPADGEDDGGGPSAAVIVPVAAAIGIVGGAAALLLRRR
jgi:energy-coupling factor transport system substrate-specific component